jgi:type IV pilus assembly protein PilN
MYSLDINFLSDRIDPEKEAQAGVPLQDTQWLVYGGAACALFLAIAGGAYFYFTYKVNELQTQVATLTAQEAVLDAKLLELKNSESVIKSIEDRTNQLVTLFVGEIPASAVLQEVRQRLPVGVQVDTITQTGKGISLVGQATSYNDVNDTLLLFQSSPYVDPVKTKLDFAKLQPQKPDISITLIDFAISTTLTNEPVTKFLPQLQKSGAEGLVQRIKLLQEKGVIQ